jgi:GAF domain-containing protein
MPHRVNTLGDTHRARLFTGQQLSRAPDPVLDRVVTEVSVELGVPIALVSLVLDRVQLFRSQVGLPPDLARAGATDRDVSFCQFVVADEAPFLVPDLAEDTRVPWSLSEIYGLRSYAGVPLRVGDEVLGSLCVMDTMPRTFPPESLARLEVFGRVVAERLIALGQEERPSRSIQQRAVAPAFAELRNLLMPLSMLVTELQGLVEEVEPITRLGGAAELADLPAAIQVLQSAGASLDAMRGSLAELESAAAEIQSTVLAMEAATLGTPTGVPLSDPLEAAATLSHHATKLVGGLRYDRAATGVLVEGSRPAVTSGLASVFSTVAGHLARQGSTPMGLDLGIAVEARSVVLRLGWGAASSRVATAVAQELAGELALVTPLALTAEGGGLRLTLPRWRALAV